MLPCQPHGLGDIWQNTGRHAAKSGLSFPKLPTRQGKASKGVRGQGTKGRQRGKPTYITERS